MLASQLAGLCLFLPAQRALRKCNVARQPDCGRARMFVSLQLAYFSLLLLHRERERTLWQELRWFCLFLPASVPPGLDNRQPNCLECLLACLCFSSCCYCTERERTLCVCVCVCVFVFVCLPVCVSPSSYYYCTERERTLWQEFRWRWPRWPTTRTKTTATLCRRLKSMS